jgi:Tryptophan-rich Synechocystis species C-terminal domain
VKCSQRFTNEYALWTTDSSGNFLTSSAVLAGNSLTLEWAELVFSQDLNGDGVIGLYATPGTTLQIDNPLVGPSGSATIGAGATLELAGADSGSVTFGGCTGTLILEAPSTFGGQIFNFTGNRSLSGSDQIDLKGINYNQICPRQLF